MLSTRTRTKATAVALVSVVVLGGAGVASAAWAISGSGSGNAAATSVSSVSSAPTTQVVANNVRVSWNATTLGNGVAVDGYRVIRHAGGSTTQVCSTTTALTCDDTSPSSSSAQYGIVAYKGTNWVSVESELSPVADYGDTTAPTLGTPVVSGTSGSNGWYRGSTAPTVTLSASDGGSGVAKIEYQIGGTAGSWTTYTTALPVPQSAGYVIHYRATDNAGNTSASQSVTVKYDGTGPSVSGISPSTGTYPKGAAWAASGSCGAGQVCAAATDGLSGIASVSYTFVSGGTCYIPAGATTNPTPNTAGNAACSQPMTLSSGTYRSSTAMRLPNANNTTYTLTVSVVDAAGNSSSSSTTITSSN